MVGRSFGSGNFSPGVVSIYVVEYLLGQAPVFGTRSDPDFEGPVNYSWVRR